MKRYRWRKATDVQREYASFELMDGEDALLDVGFTDEGVLEIAFNMHSFGRIISFSEFLQILEEGKSLAENDR